MYRNQITKTQGEDWIFVNLRPCMFWSTVPLFLCCHHTQAASPKFPIKGKHSKFSTSKVETSGPTFQFLVRDSLCHKDSCHPPKSAVQGTIGCTPNSVPMVSIVFYRDSWQFLGIVTHTYPLYRAYITGFPMKGAHVGIGVHPCLSPFSPSPTPWGWRHFQRPCSQISTWRWNLWGEFGKTFFVMEGGLDYPPGISSFSRYINTIKMADFPLVC